MRIIENTTSGQNKVAFSAILQTRLQKHYWNDSRKLKSSVKLTSWKLKRRFPKTFPKSADSSSHSIFGRWNAGEFKQASD